MRVSSLRGGLLALATSVAGLASQMATAAELVSVQVGKLEQGNDYVDKIDFRIKHARILSMCRVPTGWNIRVGNTAEFGMDKQEGSFVSGEAEVMHDALTGTATLKSLILIERDPGPHPIQISGSVGIFHVRRDNEDRRLGAGAFSFRPASHCP